MAGTRRRVRLTEVSIADIGVAETARVQAGRSGVTVMVCNSHGCAPLQSGAGTATYPSVAAAKKAVVRHNPKVRFEKEPVLPSPNMRPPTDGHPR